MSKSLLCLRGAEFISFQFVALQLLCQLFKCNILYVRPTMQLKGANII